VHCRSGGRSAKATELLREKGYDASNLEGGVLAWSDEIDSDVPQY
ncbi:MAG: molybdenum cofactor biosynthesis protein MoeB, partial [Bacteroidetes bacterium SW_11_64_17]